KSSQKIFAALPVSFEYRVNNSGGDRIVPTGQITIKNFMLWNSADVLANKKQGSVLPGSTRKLEAVWGEEPSQPRGFFGNALYELTHFHLGWYVATLSLAPAGNGQVSVQSSSFFIIPWHLLLILLLLVVIIFGFGSFALKRYNRWIISKVM